ncbi:MAG: winged helix-turn-helix transcriptional regulator [Natronomonas sp.]
MNKTRQRILEHVRANPGVHFNAIVRDLEVATGQAQYHLRRLVKRGDVDEESLFGRTHYYRPACEPWERRALSLLRRETSRQIVAMALRDGTVEAASVSSELDVVRSTVSWHLSNLEDADVVETGYTDDGRLAFELVAPERTRHLLEIVSPSATDSILDRFDRLVDDALSGE